MDLLRNLLRDDFESKYKCAAELTDVKAKSDPVSEPYKSMYEAREIWQGMKNQLTLWNSQNENISECKYILAALEFKLGSNFSDTEEKTAGIECFKKCIELLNDAELDEKTSHLFMLALNQLGITYSELTGPKAAMEYLAHAESLYCKYKKNIRTSPWTVDDLFSENSYLKNADGIENLDQKRMEAFEDSHTHTLYYLAQVYEKLGESVLSANYCHKTLRRQLDSHKYNPVDWALNAATLSQYYCSIDDFEKARHCLAAAELILGETGARPESLHVADDDEKEDGGADSLANRERIPKAWADVSRCWSKYGLQLLQYSRDRLYDEIDTSKTKVKDAKQSDKTASEKNGCANAAENLLSNSDQDSDAACADMGHLDLNKERDEWLFNLELTSMENRITDKPVCVFDEARAVFLRVQEWLGVAKDFFRLDGHCTDYVDITRDHSAAFRLLAFFEVDLERQCKMHKRRADMLQAVLNELNPQFYLLVCRQLMFEIGEIYSAILDNKLALLELQAPSSRAAMLHMGKKINSLCRQSIAQFTSYVNSLKDIKTGELPDTFSETDVRPALIAHFYMARLHSKIIEPELADQLKNVKQSLDNSNFLVTYCKNDPEGRKKVKSELEICEEMVTLLPAKMDKLLARIDGSAGVE